MVHPLITLSSLMRPLSNTKRRETIDLLSAGYSACQVAAKLGIGKSTVGRLLQELDCDKENRCGGVISSSLRVTRTHSSIKSPLDTWIMLLKQPNTSTITLIILSHHKLSTMHSKRMTFGLLSRPNDLCSSVSTRSATWSGPWSMPIGP